MHEGGHPDGRGRVVLAGQSDAGFEFRRSWALDSGTIAAHRFEAVDQQPLGELEPDLMSHPRGQRLELAHGHATESLLESLDRFAGTRAGLIRQYVEAPRGLE